MPFPRAVTVLLGECAKSRKNLRLSTTDQSIRALHFHAHGREVPARLVSPHGYESEAEELGKTLADAPAIRAGVVCKDCRGAGRLDCQHVGGEIARKQSALSLTALSKPLI